jgi:rhodanese-related sulfurtransferase
MNWFQRIFAGPDIKGYLAKKAMVIDVRTPGEFSQGHVKGAKNIPLDQIDRETPKILKANRPVITCCRSGARSGVAARKLKGAGVDVINGGPWQRVRQHQS